MLDKDPISVITHELNRVYHRRKGTNIAIRCINPLHQDSHPSFNIYVGSDPKLIGIGHCFSCGYKAHWNTIADTLGLQRLNIDNVTNDIFIPTNNCLDEGNDLNKLIADNNMGISFEIRNDWRNIPVDILNKVNACISYDMINKENCIVFPTYVNGDLLGITKFGEITKKYIHSSGTWVKRKGIYNYDIACKNREYVIIVEGIRDCLTLMKYGYNAVAVLGTQNMSNTKASYIGSTWDNVIVFTDGDKAGKDAMLKWYNMLKDECNTVSCLHTYKYYENEDPGSIENLNIGYKYLNMLMKKKRIER